MLTSHPVAYNTWHETELERWLSDNNIPYPTPADRKDLEGLIQKNWGDYAISPYKKWDTEQLTAYLKSKGVETKGAAEANKDSLVSQVQAQWYETEDKAQHAWADTKDWILDTWTDSALKSFADKNGIPGLPAPFLDSPPNIWAYQLYSSSTSKARYPASAGSLPLRKGCKKGRGGSVISW